MSTIHTVILVAHTVIAALIIVLVLVQRGKGAEAGAAFGSGASGTVFGARGTSNFFSRATGILAAVFFASSLTLAYLSSQSSQPTSLMDDAEVIEEAPADVVAPETSSDFPALPGDEGFAPKGDLPMDDLPDLDLEDEELPPTE